MVIIDSLLSVDRIFIVIRSEKCNGQTGVFIGGLSQTRDRKSVKKSRLRGCKKICIAVLVEKPKYDYVEVNAGSEASVSVSFDIFGTKSG
jgi:hypothetical protein